MSVLIKGMEMPKNCDDCRFAVDGWCYACLPESAEERRRITTNYCPLIEIPPHGDLIERDVAYDKIAEQEGGNYVDMDAVGMGLNETPVIIPAEEGE